MSKKIKLDQYYTPAGVAYKVVKKTKQIIGAENITEWLEPSAGTGMFLNFLPDDTLAYDIEPKHPKVIMADYLKVTMPYKKGRCVIGNPPYGKGNYTSVKFYKKSIEISDYISFILPVSQLNNNMYMYEFDMVYSADLGLIKFSGTHSVHCCHNIYSRPNGELNKKLDYTLDDVTIRGVARGGSRNDTVPDVYDFSICAYGSVGALCKKEDEYSQQSYITIRNEGLREKIKKQILEADWKELYNMTATPKLNHWMIYKYLRDTIPGIK